MMRFLKYSSLLLFIALSFLVAPKFNTTFAACNSNPTLLYDGKTDKPSSVVYHLRIRNNCQGANDFNIRVSELPSDPQKFKGSWKVENAATNTTFKKSVNGTENVDVTVARDTNVYQPDGNYYWVVVRAALASNPDYNDNISLVYIIVNTGQISGVVWVDENDNKQLGEKDTRLQGRSIRLDPQGSNKEDLTNAKGVYKFDNLKLNSDHTVRLADVNTCRFIIHGDNPKRNVNAGVNTDDVNFRLTRVNYRIFGTIFKDLNGDGDANDTGEGIYDKSVKVTAKGTGRSDQSDSKTGAYSITAVHDTGRDLEIVLSGLRPGESVVGGDTKTTKIECENSRVNFYIVPTPSSTYEISGKVYVDDGDNILEPDQDTSYSGNITISATNTITNASSSTSSVDGGNYVLKDIANGNYRVSIRDLSTGFTPIVGTRNGVQINDTNRTGVNFLVKAPDSSNPSTGFWFQGVGGDMRADNGLSNRIPDGRYFSASDSLLSPGIVFGSNPFNLGGDNKEKANSKGWFVANDKYSSPVVKTSYTQVRSNLIKGGVFKDEKSLFGDGDSPCGGSGSNCSLRNGLPGGIYTADKDVIITGDSYSFAGDSNYVILVNGNLTIDSNIVVPPGSTLLITVKGNIKIGEDVNRLDGIYSTDKNFSVEGAEPEDNEQLVIQGSVIANATKSGGKFTNNRDLGDDNETPSIKIVYRPDFVLNAPELIRFRNYVVREVAPGNSN
jgi:hypothetical protein